MGISLKTERLRRYKDVAVLLWKHGRSDIVRNAGLEDVLDDASIPPQGATAEAQDLANDLEAMGPTFVKLGQLLSTRTDVLPVAYVAALARLQDRVEAVPFEEVRSVVESELAVPLETAFSTFEETPLAAASLGQVHRATLRDGAPVAVKVQRPGIRERIVEDLAALRDIAEFLDRHTQWGRDHGFGGMLEEFRRTLVDELDYRLEAQNLVALARNLESYDRLVVPLPVAGHTTSRVLTMDYVRGRKLSAVAVLRRRDVDGSELAEQLFRAYLQQILVDGFFHADPHPGNVFLTEDGRLALLDLGMVARVSPGMQEKLLQWLLATSEGRADDAARAAMRIGTRTDAFDEREFRRRVTDLVMRNGSVNNLQDVEVGRIVLECARISSDCGIRLPRELTMLGKALLNLDHIGRLLDPGFDPNSAIRRSAAEIVQNRMLKSVSPTKLLGGLLELEEFAGKLPRRVNRILDTLANNAVEVKVDAIDEERLIAGLHKIANRITVGLVLAALVVAAAMLMRVPTRFELLGYPGVAIVLFAAAALGGTILVLSILAGDRKRGPRA